MPAYTFVSAGSFTTSGTPTQPAGKSVGDLLLLITYVRAAAETLIAPPTGWTSLVSTSSTAKHSCELMGRIATGDANDDISGYDFWSGTAANRCNVACFTGNIYTDLSTIVAHSAVFGLNSNQTDFPTSALTVTTDNCLIVVGGGKDKTATSNGAVFTDPAYITGGSSGRIKFVEGAAGTNVFGMWSYVQQTTAANIGADVFNQDIEESQKSCGFVVALKTQAPLDPIRLVWRV